MAFWMILVAFAAEQAVPLERLCAVADHVIHAEVTSVETRWSEGDRGEIERVVWMSVLDAVRGGPVDTLEVRQRGGELSGMIQTVEGEPTLAVDHQYVVMLQKHEGALRVIGGERWTLAADDARARDRALELVEVCRD